MPNDQDTFLFRFVLEYLQRKGYKGLSQPVSRYGRSGLLEDYGKIYRWIDGCLEVIRVELGQLTYPLLVYLYLDLIRRERYEESLKLLDEWAPKFFEQSIRDELFSLKGVRRKEQLSENPVAQLYLKHRREIFVSQYAFELLCDFLVEHRLTCIFRCIMEHFHVRLEKDSQVIVSEDLKSSIGFFPQKEFEELQKNEIHWKPLKESDYVVQEQDSQLESHTTLEGSAMLETEDDKLRRVSLGGVEALPSSLMYTFSNTYDEMNCVDISVDGSVIVAGFDDSFIRFWDGKECGQYRLVGGKPLIGHCGSIYSVSLSPCGRFFLSSSEDGTVRLWSTKLERDLVVYKGHLFPVWSVEFSPLSHYFVSGGHDRLGRLWTTDRIFPLRLFGGHYSDVEVMRWHPNCCYVASGSSDHTCRLWDLRNGNSVRLLGPHSASVCSLVFSNDGKKLVIGLENGQIEFWDIVQGRRMSRVEGHKGPVWCLDVSKDDMFFVSGSSDCFIHLWNAQSLDSSLQSTLSRDQILVKSFQTKDSAVYCARFSRKNLLLVAGVAL
ncbi:Transcription initiation factor TFIID subunit 5 [Galdieria sulphuraria]|nr:Transcription initiation factor TFIID subunit 5 [Galdieria sulphuraria]